MGWRVVVWAALVVAALVFLYYVRGILLPFVAAFLISAILDPTVQKLRRRGMSRGAAVIAIFLLFSVVVVGISVPAAQVVGQQLAGFRDQIDRYTQELKNAEERENFFVSWRPPLMAQKHGRKDQIELFLEQNRPLLERFGLPTTRRALIDQYVAPHQDTIANSVQSFFNGFFGIVRSLAGQLLFLLLTPFLALLMLWELDQLKRRSVTWVPPSIRAETVTLVSDIVRVFVGYLRGVTLAVLIYIACTSLLLMALGAPYSILLGLLFGAIYLVPYVGAMISSVTLFVVTGLSGNGSVAFVHMPSSWHAAVVMTAVFIVYGLLFDQLVYPRVVGRSVGLHPLVSMFVILSGGALFGIVGMLLAFPVAGSIKVVLDRLIRLTSEPAPHANLPAVPLRHRTGST
ncbi:MAG: AI-2E family transporter [Fimbriimonadales bacterium]|nr:AI-2E family transporter [Fimbriimonadales bacterium]